ncbi:uncharacterized protein LOC110279751 [Arachis duranensis]|uniref:Uncharacterized protein LOC110279751 n=1 Tax=Arachis duranensis TaxID=130453 RepID=A0A6P5NH32_ARADU|nr:uncharacterized protein LOC110279751 [Arachis duranensis]
MEDKKVCHQCRGKSENFMRCKNLKKQKQCKLKFCKRCLLNRYGLKIEEVGLLDDWKCPKCRDKCNCSVCLTKKGYKPTGKLIRATKSEGYDSVSQMLDTKGDEILKSVAPIHDDDDDDDDITIAALLLNDKETSSNGQEKRKVSPEGFRKEKKTKKNESPSKENYIDFKQQI